MAFAGRLARSDSKLGNIQLGHVEAAAGGITGSGGITIARPALAATGTEKFTGTATLTIQRPSLAGTGALGNAITGTATITIRKPALAGAGLLKFAGTVTLTIGKPALTASGTVTLSAVTGTGAIIIGHPTLSGNQGIAIGQVMLVNARPTLLVVPARVLR